MSTTTRELAQVAHDLAQTIREEHPCVNRRTCCLESERRRKPEPLEIGLRIFEGSRPLPNFDINNMCDGCQTYWLALMTAAHLDVLAAAERLPQKG